MSLKITVSSEHVLSTLRELGQGRQSAYVLSRALNDTAKKVQFDIKENIASGLNLRRKAWVFNQVKIMPGTWATKTRLSVTIELQQAANFIGDFEDGADHIAHGGHSWLTVPNSSVFGGKIINRDNPLKPSNLALTKLGNETKGLQRTFLITSKSSGKPLILQRTSEPNKKGKGKKGTNKETGVRLLYTLIKMSRRPKKISWYDTANKSVSINWEVSVSEALQTALASTRH